MPSPILVVIPILIPYLLIKSIYIPSSTPPYLTYPPDPLPALFTSTAPRILKIPEQIDDGRVI